MARALKISGAVVLGLIVLLLLLVFVLPRTEPGRQLLDTVARPQVEKAVRNSLGSDIDYARLGGTLPGELIIDDLVLSEDGEVWFSADRIRLEWSPLALLKRNIVVEELAVTRAELHAAPPPRPEQPEQEPQPLNLPSLRVERLAVTPLIIDEQVLGQRYEINAEASAETLGQDIAAEAQIATTTRSDTVALSVDYDPERLIAELAVNGREDGLIATLIGAGGPVSVTLDGEGPLSQWRGELLADAARYGAADASLTGDLRSLQAASLEGSLRPGPGLPPIVQQVAGEALLLDVATRQEDGGLLIALQDVSGRFGEIEGTIRLASLSAERIAVDLDGRLAEEVAGEFGADRIAGPLSLDAQAEQLSPGWAFAGTLAAPDLRLTIEEGRTTPGTLFSGLVAAQAAGLRVENPRLDPLLEQGLRANARIAYGDDGTVAVSGLDARLGRQDGGELRAQGAARYATESSRFTADLDVTAGANALQTLLGQGAFNGPLAASIDASGTPSDARARIEARIPSGELDGQAFGAGRLTADLSGLPTAPAGTARLVSEDGAYTGTLALRKTQDAILVDSLTFEGGDLSLEGDGRFAPETGAASARLALDAGEETTLITGQTIGGSAVLRLDLAAQQEALELALEATGLRFDAIEIAQADIVAQGPLSNLAYEVTLDDAALPVAYLANLAAAGRADLASEERRIVLERFRTALDEDVEENTISLLSPATITLGEEIAVSETRLDWVDDALLTLEGRYAPDLWVASVSGRGLSLPSIDASADITLAVDTREPTPARLNMTATALADDDETYELSVDGTWSGERVLADALLGRQSGDRVATAEVSFPLILTRGETLGVEVPEEGLDGRIVYNDAIAPLYAFLPLETEYVQGQLAAQVDLSGAITAPAAEGSIRLADGRFEEETVGLTLQDLNGQADLSYTGEATRLTLDLQGAGADGRNGAVSLTGDVRLGAEASSVDARLVLDQAQLVDSPQLELEVSSDLTLQGPLAELALAGDVNISELDAQIPDFGGEAQREYVPVNVVRVDGPEVDRTGEVAQAEPPLEIALDIDIRANNQLFVRGRGLTSEWQTDLSITGTSVNPVISGEVSLLDGSFAFAGRDFDLTRGEISFQRGEAINPFIDIEASYEAGSGADAVTAIIGVEGPANDPEIVLSSNPPRPDEDIMALILFGKQPTELTALESLQIANAVAQLTGTGPFGGGGGGIGNTVRSSLGLDALSFGVDSDTGEGVLAVGKYISDDVYVAARQSAGDAGTEVSVTYEVTDDFTLESRLKPNGAQDVSANYKRDY
ncbi:translocation/assembly module TamB domain-containing protein [Parvularcula oceani]|uniref:translocation/assembly module TamB domain-containing protein n=1 Tax=Parvularcula oceani TaxID=1247963 RepID=UPI0004E2195A|nr:translocation/assembly module TamB domain-containing protein [Parvularcula oceani]